MFSFRLVSNFGVAFPSQDHVKNMLTYISLNLPVALIRQAGHL